MVESASPSEVMLMAAWAGARAYDFKNPAQFGASMAGELGEVVLGFRDELQSLANGSQDRTFNTETGRVLFPADAKRDAFGAPITEGEAVIPAFMAGCSESFGKSPAPDQAPPAAAPGEA